MSSQEIFFDHPPTPEELARIACEDHSTCDDPASPDYKRVLVRPCLHIWRVLLWASVTLCLASLVGCGVYVWLRHVRWAVLAGVGVICLAILCFAKRILIWLVKVYQRFAPDKIRNRCRFEPSCSQYMILALEKYGVLRGLWKGIGRLLRCRPPHGGYDNP